MSTTLSAIIDRRLGALGVTPGDVLVQIDDSSEYAPSNGP